MWKSSAHIVHYQIGLYCLCRNSLPSYYACQVLTHMKATDTNVLLFASCSKESVAVSFVDFQAMMWQSLYNYADELYGENNPTKPSEIQPCHWN